MRFVRLCRGFCLVFCWCIVGSLAHAATSPEEDKQKIVQEKKWSVSLAPRLALSDDEKLPHGVGFAADVLFHPVERMGVGFFSGWSGHQSVNFVRAAVGVHFLLDILPILPFIQTSVGFQGRLERGGGVWSADVHFGGGVDVPLPFGGRVGITYNIFVPLQIDAFPVTKSLHLRLTLVF